MTKENPVGMTDQLNLVVYKIGDPVIYRQALQPHVPIAAIVENVLPGDKYGIRVVADRRFCVVKSERLSPADTLAADLSLHALRRESEFLDEPPTVIDPIHYDAWNGGVADAALNTLAESDSPLPEGEGLGVRVDDPHETAPSVQPVTPADFHIGQIVMYDVGTYHMGTKNPPVRATVIKIAKQKTRIVIDGTTEEFWVFPRKLSPLPEDAAPAAVLPAVEFDSPLHELANGEGLGEGLESEPRPVNLTHSAITGFCTDCGCQYDKIFENGDIDDPQIGIFVYWSAYTNPCPVCKILRTDHDTEELPAVPVSLNDADFIDPPTVNHPDQYDEDDCDAGGSGEDPDEINYPLEFELAASDSPLHELANGRPKEVPVGEGQGEGFDPAALIADLNTRITNLTNALMYAESRAEAAEDKAERFQLQVLELVRKIPAPPSPALDQTDRDRLEFLCQRHLCLSFESALGLLRFDDDYAVQYPSIDAMCKSIAQRLADRSIPVLAYNVKTEVAKNNTLYLSLSFGFASVALFNDRQTDIEHAFAHTSHHDILTTWRKTDFSYDFAPPVKIKLFRDTRGYPKLFELIEENES